MERKNNACFLSIIVPVYNTKAYLPQCLDSLLAQDVDNYEILCVDDGSKDSSLQILQEYAGRDPRVKAIHQENGGVAKARNTGLQLAAGTYIWFVDSDDWIEENCLGRIRRQLEEKPCHRLVVGSTVVQELSGENVSEAGADSVVWRNLLRREFLLEHDLCFRYPDIANGEDGLFMFEVSLQDPHKEELLDPVYFYRVRAGSAETAKSLASHQKRIHSHLRVVEVLYGYYQVPGGKTEAAANRLTSMLWMLLYETAAMPEAAGDAVKRLKKLGLFPGKGLPECTLSRSYLVSIGGFAGRLMEFLCLHLHTWWGFSAVRLLHRLRNAVRKSKALRG